MQQKQEESLNDIQIKLNETNQVKDNLMDTNGFKSNLSSFNQKETSWFGSIKLDGYWLDSLNSQIIKGEQQSIELIELCEFSPNDSWPLLYRAKRYGFRLSDFHSKCDYHSNTLEILKAKGKSYIFGGFTTVSWDSSNDYKSDPSAFIFSLTNKDNKPLKMKKDPNGHSCRIANNPNTTTYNYSNLSNTYSHPAYEFDTNEVMIFLSGSTHFQVDEIEVYQKE
jgi:hypothetical protein